MEAAADASVCLAGTAAKVVPLAKFAGRGLGGVAGGTNWKTIGVVLLGAVAVGSTAMLAYQWRHAKLGRAVQTKVVDFLKMHGATMTDKRHIAGGPVTVPITVEEAVLGTIDQVIRDINADVRAKKAAAAAAAASAAPSAGTAPAAPKPVAPAPMGGAPPPGATRPTEFPEPPISSRTGRPVKKTKRSKSPADSVAVSSKAEAVSTKAIGALPMAMGDEEDALTTALHQNPDSVLSDMEEEQKRGGSPPPDFSTYTPPTPVPPPSN